MLLLMIQAEFKAPPNLPILPVQERFHGPVNQGSVVHHVADGGTGQQPAPRPRIGLADTVVVGVEQMLVAPIHRLVGGGERLEQKGLEKPCGVGQVPLRRARLVHGLHAVVLNAQRPAKRL